MLTPLSRLRDARGSNPRAAAVPVFAGDLQDVAAQLDPKDQVVSACLKLALPAERPGIQLIRPNLAGPRRNTKPYHEVASTSGSEGFRCRPRFPTSPAPSEPS
ncbi:unnamed protein product [Gemmata massiliana]|uniref:Uncharacterized protein n=1 Tax=Gemmata massiliana TaxID=1210884 RepID=A0A6P2DD40_9BACT|nr:unnamed protein product [Gemmata massiliana]